MTRIAEIFDIPKDVQQGDFVLRLTEGVIHPDSTLGSYVVTRELQRCFDQALSLIGSAVSAQSSKGTYLHGSFGSGKSHFMAVLSLLLDNHSEARAVPELAEVVQKHQDWTSRNNFLVVPYHMIGAPSMEAAILGGYVQHVRKQHPDVRTPPVYRSEALFEDARNLRAQMGDDKFFAGLASAGADGADDDGWGDLASGWDAASFEAAMDAEPGDELRGKLVTDLVDSYFKKVGTFSGEGGEGFVSLDEGLAVISRHAQALGYDGLVLFLDELILWLASHASDVAFINRESQKITKLVEATDADRPIPIVSFIARQRDLRELVSEHMGGREELSFGDVLSHFEARFGKITLEDRNLPAIVEKRILKPVSEDARRQVDEAFAKAARERESVLQTLLTRDFSVEQFRQVYPFSPVLVKALVALSALLQRERTALKLLMQLLVNQQDSLELGDIVPVGDLYDVLEEGDEPFSQAMRVHFDQARSLYRKKMLPLLANQHNVTVDAIENGDLDADAMRRVRNDARLMKTLLLSALADGVEDLAALTPARLAALNHGSVRSPVPGQEASTVLTKCRQWAGQIGEIKISDDEGGQSAIISLRLVGVDTDGILQNALGADNPGARAKLVRELLYDGLGMPIAQEDLLRAPRFAFAWRGTQRECEVQIMRPQEMALDNFAPQDAPWKVVMGLPTGGSIADDRAQVQDVQERDEDIQTIVWLPSHLSARGEEDLKRLVIHEHILAGSRLQDKYGRHLSQADREQARVLLRNQRDQLRQRVRSNLLTAYGISTINPDAVESDPEREQRFTAFSGSLDLQPPVGADVREALQHLMGQALVNQYPAHPQFGMEIKRSFLRKVLEAVTRAAGDPQRRTEVPREDRELMRQIAVPLQLGQMGETHFVLGDHWESHFHQCRSREQVDQVTVRRLRQWLDEPEPRGLPKEVGNLVVLSFAEQTNRRFFLHGGAVDGRIEALEDAMELRDQPLPDTEQWQRALERAGKLFGEAVPNTRNANNVGRLTEKLRELAEDYHDGAHRYVERLEPRLRQMGVSTDQSERYRSACAARDLLAGIKASNSDDLVAVLAQAELPSDALAVGSAIKHADALARQLEQPGAWEVFNTLEGLDASWHEQTEPVLKDVCDALRRDEHVVALIEAIGTAQTNALTVIGRAAKTSAPEPVPEQPLEPGPEPGKHSPRARSGSYRAPVANLNDAVSALQEAVREASEEAEVEVRWTVYEQETGDE